MNRPRHVDGTNGRGGRLEVRAGTGLVAKRPDHYAGVVLVALDHAFLAIDVGFLPTVDAAQRVAAVAHAV